MRSRFRAPRFGRRDGVPDLSRVRQLVLRELLEPGGRRLPVVPPVQPSGRGTRTPALGRRGTRRWHGDPATDRSGPGPRSPTRPADAEVLEDPGGSPRPRRPDTRLAGRRGGCSDAPAPARAVDPSRASARVAPGDGAHDRGRRRGRGSRRVPGARIGRRSTGGRGGGRPSRPDAIAARDRTVVRALSGNELSIVVSAGRGCPGRGSERAALRATQPLSAGLQRAHELVRWGRWVEWRVWRWVRNTVADRSADGHRDARHDSRADGDRVAHAGAHRVADAGAD